MARIHEDNSKSIGNTPLVKLGRISQGTGATLVGKIEGRNPAYSVKCRIGVATRSSSPCPRRCPWSAAGC